MALSNIAGESNALRDQVLNEGLVDAIMNMVAVNITINDEQFSNLV